jgi:RNA polymerase sigma factor (sigma-70 family)
MTRRWADDSHADRLLSQLYQDVAEQKGVQFGAGYDIAAGLDRYLAWLREHTAEDRATLAARQLARAMALHPSADGAGIMTTWWSEEAVTAAAATQEPAGAHSLIRGLIRGTWADQHVGPEVAALYRKHWRPLIRMAVFLLGDMVAAVKVAEDALVAMNAAWPWLADRDRAEAYLYRSAVNLCRSVLRDRADAAKVTPGPAPDTLSAEQAALLAGYPMISALRALPIRQREVLVLRYQAKLPDDQIAAAMGISKAAVTVNAARALLALRWLLRKQKE